MLPEKSELGETDEILASPTSTFLALESEYRGAVLKRSRELAGKRRLHESRILELFATVVLPGCTDLFISDDDLRQRISVKIGSTSHKSKLVADAASVLLGEGYLLSRVDLPEVRCYWFAVPNVGRIVQWILDARVELAGIVDRALTKKCCALSSPRARSKRATSMQYTTSKKWWQANV